MANQTKVHPCAHRLLVKIVTEEFKSPGGIIVTAKDPYDSSTGEVVEVGFSAFADYADGQAWVNEGDKILFVKSAGRVVPDELTGDHNLYRMINDVDVIARLDN